MQNLSFGKILTSQEGSSVTNSFFSEEGELIYEIIHYTTSGRAFFKISQNCNSFIGVKNVKIDQPPLDQLKMALQQVDELQEIIKGIDKELIQ
ncbi:MAG: hypothetical protein J0L87_11600 [Bacteroidetes bacterium]|nr:hypothetical protein [Bacteroidota bacterium]